MRDVDVTEIDQTVIDAVGELGNMVVGGAKRRLCEFALTMSLPSVICAGIESVQFQSNANPLRLQYRFDQSSLAIWVALNGQS